LPVQTPVSQQPQSHAAQQAPQFAGQAPPQHEAGADDAGAKSDMIISTRKYMT
jgi:hypothetical protein